MNINAIHPAFGGCLRLGPPRGRPTQWFRRKIFEGHNSDVLPHVVTVLEYSNMLPRKLLEGLELYLNVAVKF